MSIGIKTLQAILPTQVMVFLVVMTVLSSALSGCATRPGPTITSAHQARIRVFHGVGSYIYFGDVCDGKSHPVIHAAAGGFSYFVPNKKIGMPQTKDMPSFSYHEYAIPAEQPVTIKMYWQAQKANKQWDSCGPNYVTFTPKSGQDYDTFMKFSGGMCEGVDVREFASAPDKTGRVSTRPAAIQSAFENCWY